MLELFPEGFEEVDADGGLELAAYTGPGGEERVWQVFGPGRVDDVDPDWGERWRAFHQPVGVGPLWIGPPWESPTTDALAVVVDPGRAFGTGASDDEALRRASLRGRAGEPARRRLRLGRAVDRGGEARLLARDRARRGSGRRRGDARERARERRRDRRRKADVLEEPLPSRPRWSSPTSSSPCRNGSRPAFRHRS